MVEGTDDFSCRSELQLATSASQMLVETPLNSALIKGFRELNKKKYSRCEAFSLSLSR